MLGHTIEKKSICVIDRMSWPIGKDVIILGAIIQTCNRNL